MGFYNEITVWTRGIIMDKEGRDVANCVAQAGNKEGRYTQYINDYVDAPDRTNCLVRKYARLSDSVIEDALIYENPHPNIIVLIEETLLKAVNYLKYTPPGEGVVVVNSARDPEYLLKFIPDPEQKLKRLVVVDATGLAEREGASPWMYIRSLTELSYDRMSTEGSAEKRRVGVGIAAPLVGAIAAATGIVKLDTLSEIVADKDAMLRGAASAQVLEYAARKAAV